MSSIAKEMCTRHSSKECRKHKECDWIRPHGNPSGAKRCRSAVPPPPRHAAAREEEDDEAESRHFWEELGHRSAPAPSQQQRPMRRPRLDSEDEESRRRWRQLTRVRSNRATVPWDLIADAFVRRCGQADVPPLSHEEALELLKPFMLDDNDHGRPRHHSSPVSVPQRILEPLKHSFDVDLARMLLSRGIKDERQLLSFLRDEARAADPRAVLKAAENEDRLNPPQSPATLDDIYEWLKATGMSSDEAQRAVRRVGHVDIVELARTLMSQRGRGSAVVTDDRIKKILRSMRSQDPAKTMKEAELRSAQPGALPAVPGDGKYIGRLLADRNKKG